MSNPTSVHEMVNWQDTQVAALRTEIGAAQATLTAALMHDVQPNDLRIDGTAVRDELVKADVCYLGTGVRPEASVTLEQWVTNDGLLAHIAKIRSGRVTRNKADILAQQVRHAGEWLPLLLTRRTARIAGLVAVDSTLSVSIFEAPASFEDDTFQRLREAVAAGKTEGTNLQHHTAIYPTTIDAFNRERLLITGAWLAKGASFWERIQQANLNQDTEGLTNANVVRQALEAQATAQPSDTEVAEATQMLVGTELEKLRSTAQTLGTAVTLMQTGERIRPGKPLHMFNAGR